MMKIKIYEYILYINSKYICILNHIYNTFTYINTLKYNII